MRRPKPTALLIDFDGVLRHYDRRVKEIAFEERHGLAPGSFLDAGLETSRYVPAVTGRWTHEQWLASIAQAAGVPLEALVELCEYRGYVDPAVLAFVREVRAAGRPVGLATNATDRLRDDLRALGVEGEFDAVTSSAELGWHKPTREFFAAACAAIGTPAREVLFVDDSDRNVRGARAAGLSALRYTGVSDLGYVATALGVPASPVM